MRGKGFEKIFRKFPSMSEFGGWMQLGSTGDQWVIYGWMRWIEWGANRYYGHLLDDLNEIRMIWVSNGDDNDLPHFSSQNKFNIIES